jgi:hypothetical protein
VGLGASEAAAATISEVLVPGVPTGSIISGIEDEPVAGRGGVTGHWPTVWPSSASSVISSSLLRRDEAVEEELEGAAVCREQADVRAASLSSSAVVMEMEVSWGVNLSATAVEWTATRARAHVSLWYVNQHRGSMYLL